MKGQGRLIEVSTYMVLLFIYDHFGYIGNKSNWMLFMYALLAYFPIRCIIEWATKNIPITVKIFYWGVCSILIFNFIYLVSFYDRNYEVFVENMKDGEPLYYSTGLFILLFLYLLFWKKLKSRFL